MRFITYIIILFSFSLFGQEKNQLDYLYPNSDLVIDYHDEWGSQHYKKRINIFKKNPLSANDVVFLGNSITEGGKNWNDRLNYPQIKNRGISGDVTDGVLARLDEIIYFKPKMVFLLIGINDLWNTSLNIPSTEYIGDNIVKIAKTIKKKSPQTLIYIQTILPIHKENFKPKIERINKIIYDYKENNLYQVIDLFSVFSNENGLMNDEYTTDGVHLNEKGYNVWVKTIKPLF